MHSQGYTYIGPTSLYRLTFDEMLRLHAAYGRAEEAQRQDVGARSTAGSSPGPSGSAPTPGRIRESDLRAAKSFAQRRATDAPG